MPSSIYTTPIPYLTSNPLFSALQATTALSRTQTNSTHNRSYQHHQFESFFLLIHWCILFQPIHLVWYIHPVIHGSNTDTPIPYQTPIILCVSTTTNLSTTNRIQYYASLLHTHVLYSSEPHIHHTVFPSCITTLLVVYHSPNTFPPLRSEAHSVLLSHRTISISQIPSSQSIDSFLIHTVPSLLSYLRQPTPRSIEQHHCILCTLRVIPILYITRSLCHRYINAASHKSSHHIRYRYDSIHNITYPFYHLHYHPLLSFRGAHLLL